MPILDREQQIRLWLEREPEDPFLNHALAMNLLGQGRRNEAGQILRCLLERDPGYTGSYYQLGKILESEGALGEAAQVYETGMRQARILGDERTLLELREAREGMDY